MKKIFIIFLFTLFLSCADDRQHAGELIDYLPQEAAVIVQMQNPDLFFNNLQNNDFIKQNLDHSFIKGLKERLSILQDFPHQKEALLVLTPKGENSYDFLFISRDHLKPKFLDSIPNKQIETISTDDLEIKKYLLEGKTAFSTTIDSISILSNSRALLEQVTQQERTLDPQLEVTFKAASKKKSSIFINHKKAGSFMQDLFPKGFSDLSSWTVVDTDISQTDIRLNGITTASDSISNYIDIFKETGVSSNTLAKISPVNSSGFISISFRNFEKLNQNISFLRGKTESDHFTENSLLENATEAGVINLPEGKSFIINTIDPEIARSTFDFDLTQAEEYRGFPLFEYPNTNSFQEILQPLLNPEELQFFTFLDTYIIFASNTAALKSIITAVQNEQVLSETEAYKASSENLSSEASLLIVRNKQAQQEEDLDGFNYQNYPISAVQFIYQDSFAHLHGTLSKNATVNTGKTTAQAAAIKLGSEVASLPVFFKNHRTNGLDIAVQDVQNTLYLISPEGKIYWKKELNSRILGKVETVDILKNGRYQLAFATQNEVHVLDRDGNPVKPFPLKFRDEITQPLSVFDYDNKKDYRFVVTQGTDLYMYDRKGNSVKGFKFPGTGSNITQPPKHIRIGRKDYIVIPETSRRLNILSRTGQIRVAVKENLDLTQNKWYEYDGNFVSTNNSGQLIKITESGKIAREDLNLADNHYMTATEKSLVTLSENELTIKGKTVTLDFGLYGEPDIFYINNKIYVSVTDLQAEKVYLFDSNAALLNGFPVYGNSAIDLGNADADAALELTVKGGDHEVLVYEVK